MSIVRALISFIFVIVLFSSASAGQLQLSWDDKSENENGFDIQRCENAGCTNFVTTASSPAVAGTTRITFFDNNVLEGKTYCYRVRAFQGTISSQTVSSAFSNTACASSILPAPVNLTVVNVP